MNRVYLALCLIIVTAHTSFSQSERDLKILEQFPNKETVIYKVIEGDTLDMLLFFPKQQVKKKTPVVLYTHGGGWEGGDKYKVFREPFLSALKQILNQGVACATIEYRLTREEISTAFDCVVDCKDAARFLMKNSEEFNIDVNRMGVWGGSAGGHLALMTGLASNDLFVGEPELKRYDPFFKCIVSFYPMVIFTKPELNEGSNFSKPSRFIPMLGGLLKENMELARKLSPVEHLHKSSPATLLVHGNQDNILPVAQSHYFMEIAEKKKSNVKYIEVKGAKHNFSGNDISPTMEEINNTTAAFIIKHLK